MKKNEKKFLIFDFDYLWFFPWVEQLSHSANKIKSPIIN